MKLFIASITIILLPYTKYKQERKNVTLTIGLLLTSIYHSSLSFQSNKRRVSTLK